MVQMQIYQPSIGRHYTTDSHSSRSLVECDSPDYAVHCHSRHSEAITEVHILVNGDLSCAMENSDTDEQSFNTAIKGVSFHERAVP